MRKLFRAYSIWYIIILLTLISLVGSIIFRYNIMKPTQFKEKINWLSTSEYTVKPQQLTAHLLEELDQKFPDITFNKTPKW